MKYGIGFCIEKRANSKGADTPINMNISFNGQYHRYYTGERCKPDQWADQRTEEGERVQRVKRNAVTPKGETASDINRRLQELKSVTVRYFTQCEALKKEPTKVELWGELDRHRGKIVEAVEPIKIGFFERFEQFKTEKNFSDVRRRQLKVAKKKLQTFAPSATFESITPEFLTRYQNLLFESLSKNSVNAHLKYLRAFMNHANKMAWTENYPFKKFSLPGENYGEPVYITLQERDHLFNAEIEVPHLARVRDIFVFQCLIGCRVGDLLRLKKSNIIDDCIEYIAGKTKDDQPRVARIPLSTKAKTILSRYDLPGDELLPFIPEQKYNDYIKDLFRATGLNRVVTIRDPQTGLARQVPISEIASSHMARRVFIGGLYLKGVKNEIIASMSGHFEDSKSFKRYYAIAKENQLEAMKLIE